MKDVQLRNFIVETEEDDDHVCRKEKKNSASHVWRTTAFPIGEVNGSRFGTCTCGSPRMMGVPCMHMVVALKSGSVEVSTRKLLPDASSIPCRHGNQIRHGDCLTNVRGSGGSPHSLLPSWGSTQEI